jgi:excisionase family DNA binding protein
VVKVIAERAAEIVLERLSASSPTSPYLSVAEAAERIRAKPQRVHDLLSARRLTRYKDGRRTLVSREELDAYIVREGRSRVAPTLPPPSQARSSKGLAA